jgi:hypothetical protein
MTPGQYSTGVTSHQNWYRISFIILSVTPEPGAARVLLRHRLFSVLRK